MKIGNQIHQLRKLSGMTQEQMAENDPTSDGTGTADQADAAADDTDKQNASAKAGEIADNGEAVQEDAAQEQESLAYSRHR